VLGQFETSESLTFLNLSRLSLERQNRNCRVGYENTNKEIKRGPANTDLKFRQCIFNVSPVQSTLSIL
jgi:hypothetical protein